MPSILFQNGRYVLRVIYNETRAPVAVVTAYFDNEVDGV